jgi:hypothetical protein
MNRVCQVTSFHKLRKFALKYKNPRLLPLKKFMIHDS